VRLALGFYGIVTLFALGFDLFSRVRGSGASDGVPLLSLSLPAWEALLAGLGVALVVVALTRVGRRAWSAVDRAARELASLLGPIGWKEAWLIALASGVGEELLFRGALWPYLGLLGTTLLFGLVHVVPRRALWGYPLFAALVGLLIGLLREASGSVLPCVIAHVVVNGLNLSWLGGRYHELVAAPAASPPPA
jgi:membrane protease YdiL (CAAX protease family)